MNEDWETRINELLDGELDPQQVAELRREAENNARLAQDIIDAYALQARLDELDVERAPDSLRAKLAGISGSERKQPVHWFGLPRWVPMGALAAVPVLVIAMVMMQPQPQSQAQPQSQPGAPEYTEAEILQARQDVMTAFAYLDRIGSRTGHHIESELAEELSRGVTKNVSRYIPYTNASEQEENS